METISCKYSGVFNDPSGYGSANRAFVTALHLAGVDVTLELVTQTREQAYHGWEQHLCTALLNRNVPYKVKIIHLTPDIYEPYLEKGKYHIGHLFWETDSLPKEWIDPINKMGEIWTSSPNMAELFKRGGVKVPIYWFPQPIDITMADKDFGKFQVDHHMGVLFYSIFQWIERKNPRALLHAYWKAFQGKDDVSLLLKTFRLSYDQKEFNHIRDDITRWKQELGLSHYPRVLLCTKLMSDFEMMRLHNTGDCFVTAHRGEGWSRPIQESLLIGKPVIATARGGIHEYLRDNHYYPVNSKYVPVTEVPYIKFYKADQKWAEVDEAELIKSMQFVYANPRLASAKGVLAKDMIKNQFNYHRIGGLMRERLEEIYKSL